jgi:hypothetical protein
MEEFSMGKGLVEHLPAVHDGHVAVLPPANREVGGLVTQALFHIATRRGT